MKISVIIPMYNSARTIESCIDSVRVQTYKVNYEVIIINDGSTDNSVEIVFEYIKRHNILNIVVLHKDNGGVSSARNQGLRFATGDYIALLDSDDVWLPQKIELQIDNMLRYPHIDYIGSNILSSNISILGRKKDRLARIKTWELFISWHPQTSTVLFKRDILQDIGFYNEKMTHGEDGEYLLRICCKKECWFMPDQLVDYSQGKHGFGQSGLSANLIAMQNGQMQILYYAYENRITNYFQYVLLKGYIILKFWRRLILTQFRKW